MTPLKFVRENNRIEGIHREPTDAELIEFARFINLEEITLVDLTSFVQTYQPGASLRDRVHMDVRVGRHMPPRGGPHIRDRLEGILLDANDPHVDAYKIHLEYEQLHPFMDGNGRSGRMLWAWIMGERLALSLRFLHRFYYQTLDAQGGRA